MKLFFNSKPDDQNEKIITTYLAFEHLLMQDLWQKKWQNKDIMAMQYSEFQLKKLTLFIKYRLNTEENLVETDALLNDEIFLQSGIKQLEKIFRCTIYPKEISENIETLKKTNKKLI